MGCQIMQSLRIIALKAIARHPARCFAPYSHAGADCAHENCSTGNISSNSSKEVLSSSSSKKRELDSTADESNSKRSRVGHKMQIIQKLTPQLVQEIIDYITEAGRLTADAVPIFLFQSSTTQLELRNSKLSSR